MRVRYTIFFALLFSSYLMGQQQDHFTQFMHNRLGINPAFAGAENAPTFTALMRNQWIGFEGAPQTQMLSFHMPVLSEKVGLGGTVLRSSIGLTERYTAGLDYSYRIRLGNGFFRMGLKTSVRLIRMDFRKAEGTQPVDQDQAIPVGFQSKYVPNFGAGIYYQGKDFYFGVSVPRLLENNIDLSDSDLVISREIQHFYLNGGITFRLSDESAIQTHMLLKYVEGAPFDGDINISMVFAERFTAGLSYRLGGSEDVGFGEAFSGLIGVGITKNIELGISYDFTISELRQYSSGTIEAMLRYRIGSGGEGPNTDLKDARNF